jgi:hypothetical protein
LRVGQRVATGHDSDSVSCNAGIEKVIEGECPIFR